MLFWPWFVIPLHWIQQDEENAKAISLFENVVSLNDAIEDEGKRLENLVRGIFAGNIFDLGSAEVGWFSIVNLFTSGVMVANNWLKKWT